MMELLLTEKEKNELIKIVQSKTIPLSPIKTGVNPSLERISDIKAVLFDIYGTLLISGSGDIGTSKEKENQYPVSELLVESGFELLHNHLDTRISKLITHYIRKKHQESKDLGVDYPEVDILDIWEKIINQLEKDHILKGSSTTMQIVKMALFYELKVNPVYPMPGCFEILSDIKKRSIPMGIVSNAQFYTPFTLEAFAGKSLSEIGFSEEYCSWSYQLLKAKPSLEIFRSVLENLKKNYGIDSEDVLYIGNDMLNDIYTAKKNGCKAAVFAGDARSYRERAGNSMVKDIQADYCITELSQIKMILQSGD